MAYFTPKKSLIQALIQSSRLRCGLRHRVGSVLIKIGPCFRSHRVSKAPSATYPWLGSARKRLGQENNWRTKDYRRSRGVLLEDNQTTLALSIPNRPNSPLSRSCQYLSFKKSKCPSVTKALTSEEERQKLRHHSQK